MSRRRRRSIRADVIAPWLALSIILLLMWAGAKIVRWTGLTVPTTIQTQTTSSEDRKGRAISPSVTEPAVVAAPTEPAIKADVTVTAIDVATLRKRALSIPVRGVSADELVDSFDDARGGRKHHAIDILAPRGTDVLAVENGRIEKLFFSAAGGLTIYQFDPSEQFVYYYAHLDRYAPDVKEGTDVKRGQVIGYVGTSGNASNNTPHLHFSIEKLGPDRRWWQGTPLDPFLVWRGPIIDE